MSSLADLIPSLQRAVATPGTFDDLFPDPSDEDLTGLLLDAFAEAQLDLWFTSSSADDTGEVTPDLTRAQAALVVIYASVRMLMSEIRNRKTHTRYEAGSAVFEQDQSATMLVQLLKDMQERKKELIIQARQVGMASAFVMADQYCVRQLGTDFWSPLYVDNGNGWGGSSTDWPVSVW